MLSDNNPYSDSQPLEQNTINDVDKLLKKRVVIICSVLALTIIVSGIGWFWWCNSSSPGRYAHLYQYGTLIDTIDLAAVSNDYTFTITGEDGSYNIIEIHDQKIHIIDASCPDLVCVHTGYGQNNILPITCLPNSLIIKVTSQPAADSNEGDIDAYTY